MCVCVCVCVCACVRACVRACVCVWSSWSHMHFFWQLSQDKLLSLTIVKMVISGSENITAMNDGVEHTKIHN